MAKTAKNTKAAPKKAVKKQAVKPVSIKPIKETLSKSALVAHLAESTALATKDVRSMLVALEHTIHASLNKKGVGSFTLRAC